MDPQQRLHFLQWTLERQLNWIGAADTKVGAIVAADTAMIAGVGTAYALVSNRPVLAMATSAIAVILVAAAMFCAAMAMLPRGESPNQSAIYFGTISERSIADYVQFLHAITSVDIANDLSQQVYRNAQIAAAKHKWVRLAVLISFTGTIPWGVAIIALVRAA